MEASETVCPVCTLYLREGITLQAHLDTHPKERVIEALLKVSKKASIPTSDSPSCGNFNVPVQSLNNPQSSYISTPYVTPQAQMTTAVTYQHFVTSNGSTLLPQYIQVPTVINPSSNIPLMPNQTMNYIPNQSVNYSQTLYNPLYNPYIPHPYPFQPVYANLPVTTASSNEISIQENPNNSNCGLSEPSNGEVTAPPSNVPKKICNVTPSGNESEKRSNRLGSKRSVIRCTKPRRKRRLFRNKLNDPSSSLSVIRSPVKGATISKRSVITSTVPKIPLATTSRNSSVRIVTPPPLTLIPGGNINTIPGSKTPPLPPPPLSKAPFITSQSVGSYIKKEDITFCARPRSTPAIYIGSASSNSLKYLEQSSKVNSVIMESNAVGQGDKNELKDCDDLVKTVESEASCIQRIMKSVIINQEGKNTMSDVNIRDPLSIEDNEVSSDNGRLIDEFNNGERQEEDMEETDESSLEKQEESVFQMIEVGEESKIDIVESTLNEKLLDEVDNQLDVLTQRKNAVFCETSIERSEPEFVGVQSSELVIEGCEEEREKSKPSEQNYCTKPYCESLNNSNENELVETTQKQNVLRPISYVNLQPTTYTDLQPTINSKPFQEFGLTPNIKLSSFMEVDGIKIFLNSNTPNLTFDPLMKITTSDCSGSSNHNNNNNHKELSCLLQPENSVNNPAVIESVIQIVSGSNESKNAFNQSENFAPTTSQVYESHLELSSLSPLALNIQADESMPARGELSEQESLGAENSAWNLFHGENISDSKILETWRNSEIPQVVSVIECKKSSKKFKCSICNEVFSCAKERRVHKNTAHVTKSDKDSSSMKKNKYYPCNYCSEIFTSLRDRKSHLEQNHYNELRSKKNNNQIKQEKNEIESTSVDKLNADIKNESGQVENVKSENLLSTSESESPRVKYCSHCSLPFVNLKKLREHLRLLHGRVHLKCETCSQNFDEETEYNEHLLVHPLVCDKCGKTFHKKANLNLHMRRHLEVRPYECSLCPKSFITRQKLEEHKNGHSGKKPLKCTLCDKTFSRHSNLIQHRNLHHLNLKKKIKDFVCRCGEVFHSLRKLEWHKEVHEPKPKPCPFCSRKFIHSASVTRHIRRAHIPGYLPGDNREFDNVQCPVCEKVYLRSSLAVHMRVHNGERPFGCQICNKRFSTKWNLELHNWTHQSRNDMPYKCNICKSAFFRESDFVGHVNSHRNYKPYTCNVCGQKFTRKYSCLRHQEEHKKSKQFVCAVNGCAKSFHRGYYLRDHMKIHSGIRPHTCHICGKASSTKSNHNKHVRIHDTREPVNTEN